MDVFWCAAMNVAARRYLREGVMPKGSTKAEPEEATTCAACGREKSAATTRAAAGYTVTECPCGYVWGRAKVEADE